MPETVRQRVRRMVVATDTEAEAARAVARVCGWNLSPVEERRRFMQCLRGAAGRHLEADALPEIVRVVVRAGGDDLVTGLLDAARRDGEHERLEQTDAARERDRKRPLRVEYRQEARRVSVAQPRP